MRGSAPHGERYCGAPRPAPRHEGEGFYGASPQTPLEDFSPQKSPRPEKTNWIRYILSSIDSEQGCRRQPCFFVWRRQHGTATAPLPHSPAAPEPAARLARTRPPHCTYSHRTHIAHTVPRPHRSTPSPRTARARLRSSPRRSSETAGL